MPTTLFRLRQVLIATEGNALVDLRHGVLDIAMVESVACVVEKLDARSKLQE